MFPRRGMAVPGLRQQATRGKVKEMNASLWRRRMSNAPSWKRAVVMGHTRSIAHYLRQFQDRGGVTRREARPGGRSWEPALQADYISQDPARGGDWLPERRWKTDSIGSVVSIQRPPAMGPRWGNLQALASESSSPAHIW